MDRRIKLSSLAKPLDIHHDLHLLFVSAQFTFVRLTVNLQLYGFKCHSAQTPSTPSLNDLHMLLLSHVAWGFGLQVESNTLRQKYLEYAL